MPVRRVARNQIASTSGSMPQLHANGLKPIPRAVGEAYQGRPPKVVEVYTTGMFEEPGHSGESNDMSRTLSGNEVLWATSSLLAP